MNYKQSILCLGLLTCLTGCSEEVVDTYVPPLQVETISPVREDFLTHGSSVAQLEPGSRVMVMPGITGEVEEVFVSLGDKVNIGDLICIIDSEAVETQCENADDAVSRAMDSINTLTESMLVKAPVSGYIQSIDESLSHSVSGSSQLAYISNQQQMTVKLPFLQSAVSNAWIGASAQLSFVDTGENLTGTVTEISGSPDYLYGNIPVNYVTISVNNPGGIPVGRKVAGSVQGVNCSADGSFESQASSPVMSGLAGTLDEIYVSVGQYVAAGTPMFRVVTPSSESQLKSAQDGLSDAVKARDDAYDLLADYQVTANIAGTVSDVYVKNLDFLGQTGAVIEISTTEQMELTFSVSEAVLPFLSRGQDLTISSQGKEVFGAISEISTVASAQNGLFTIKGVIEEEDILTGTTASVSYVDFLVEDALTIPFEAIHFVGEESFVYVIKDNTAWKTPVEVAQFTADKIIITQGISENDVLISSWSAQLRNGLQVETTASEEAS
ncbi:MAG: HlyD family efflux transporter periplasmic adaptor subunit [Eubacteriales bacterium]